MFEVNFIARDKRRGKKFIFYKKMFYLCSVLICATFYWIHFLLTQQLSTSKIDIEKLKTLIETQNLQGKSDFSQEQYQNFQQLINQYKNANLRNQHAILWVTKFIKEYPALLISSFHYEDQQLTLSCISSLETLTQLLKAIQKSSLQMHLANIKQENGTSLYSFQIKV